MVQFHFPLPKATIQQPNPLLVKPVTLTNNNKSVFCIQPCDMRVTRTYPQWVNMTHKVLSMFGYGIKTVHTDIGMVPHMKEAKAWCTFYEPINQ